MTARLFPILSLLAILIAYGPLLIEFAANLWSRLHYQHFPFILLASVLLFTQRLQHSEVNPASAADRAARSGHQIGSRLVVFIVAWLLLLAAYQLPSPLFAAISFVVLLGGLGGSLAAKLNRPFPFGPWMLLWLLIPPPLGLDRRLIESLQRISSGLSSQALDLLGVRHLMDGNTLLLADRQLFVDEACSGIVSVISVVTCAAIYGVWRQRATLHTLLLMAAAAGWAMLLNVVRITAIALAHVFWGLDWAEGTAHTLLGLGMFSLSIVTLVATDWLLRAMLSEVGPRWAMQTAEPIRFGKPLVRLWDWLAQPEVAGEADRPDSRPLSWHRVGACVITLSLGLFPLVAFAGLGATQLLRSTKVESITKTTAFPDSSALANRLQTSVMPEELVGLKLQEVEHSQRPEGAVFGEHSVIYSYVADNGDRYLVSCDFPFVGGWHELAICYRGIGWRVDDRLMGHASTDSESTPQGDSEIEYGWAQMGLTKPDGRVAVVTFCACYQNGDPVEPMDDLSEGVWSAFLHALSRRDRSFDERKSFQVQVLAERIEQLSEQDRKVSLQLLDEARRRFIAASIATE